MNQHTSFTNIYRIVIADDNPDMRRGLQELLELDSGIQVAGCAGNGFEALKLCDQITPDLVLMALIMPVCDGVIATRLIKAVCPWIKVLMVIGMENEEKTRYAFQSGADGYLLKPVEVHKMRTAVKNTIAGVAQFDGEVFIPLPGTLGVNIIPLTRNPSLETGNSKSIK